MNYLLKNVQLTHIIATCSAGSCLKNVAISVVMRKPAEAGSGCGCKRLFREEAEVEPEALERTASASGSELLFYRNSENMIGL